jgi:hypothetical protein
MGVVMTLADMLKWWRPENPHPPLGGGRITDHAACSGRYNKAYSYRVTQCPGGVTTIIQHDDTRVHVSFPVQFSVGAGATDNTYVQIDDMGGTKAVWTIVSKPADVAGATPSSLWMVHLSLDYLEIGQLIQQRIQVANPGGAVFVQCVELLINPSMDMDFVK